MELLRNCYGIIAPKKILKIRQVTVVQDYIDLCFWNLPGMPMSRCMRRMGYGHQLSLKFKHNEVAYTSQSKWIDDPAPKRASKQCFDQQQIQYYEFSWLSWSIWNPLQYLELGDLIILYFGSLGLNCMKILWSVNLSITWNEPFESEEFIQSPGPFRTPPTYGPK